MLFRSIHDLVKQARGENDIATEQFLQWYVGEQVEEVATTTQLAEMVKHAQNLGQLMMLEGRVARMVEERD